MSEKPRIDDWKDFQLHIFSLIGERYSSRQRMVADLEELLDVNRAAVYDRIALRRKLTLSECFILLRHFQITTKVISELWTSKVLVNFAAMERVPNSLEEYLHPLYTSMQAMALMNGVHLYYAANELPFYHYYRRPKVALFKYYIWHMLSWKQDDAPEVNFDQDFIAKHLTRLSPLFDEMVSLYSRFATTEIWHTNLLHNSLHQIEYLHHIGLLPDKDLAMELCDDLTSILSDLEKMASKGHKEGHPEHGFYLYHNELAHTNNMALIKAPDVSQVFFAYDNPNVMYAKDARLGEYTLHYFERLISHAESLIIASNKARTVFFNRLKQLISTYKNQFQARLGD